VSPYFFVWATRAAEKYYLNDPKQREMQALLVGAVAEHVHSKGTHCYASLAIVRSQHIYPSLPFPPGSGINVTTPLQQFARRTAGRPLLYGICLQKQHLDPNHNPRKLQVRNGQIPFLYRYIVFQTLFDPPLHRIIIAFFFKYF